MLLRFESTISVAGVRDTSCEQQLSGLLVLYEEHERSVRNQLVEGFLFAEFVFKSDFCNKEWFSELRN